ncbi:MAG: chemotaxis protein CheD [Dehalococcoidia bacterium]|nr:chemotaxis protein CheD [Dehalococcoidia bacterium]
MTTTATTEKRSPLGTALSLGEWAVSADADAVLACVGLGSCVAVTMHDPVAKVGGMAHMVLPDSTAGRSPAAGAKFVDVAIPLLLEELQGRGALVRRLRVCLAGGAQMLQNSSGAMQIGQRNGDAAHQQLAARSLSVSAESLGGTRGRTMRLAIGTGRVTVTVPGEQEIEL